MPCSGDVSKYIRHPIERHGARGARLVQKEMVDVDLNDASEERRNEVQLSQVAGNHTFESLLVEAEVGLVRSMLPSDWVLGAKKNLP